MILFEDVSCWVHKLAQGQPSHSGIPTKPKKLNGSAYQCETSSHILTLHTWLAACSTFPLQHSTMDQLWTARRTAEKLWYLSHQPLIVTKGPLESLIWLSSNAGSRGKKTLDLAPQPCGKHAYHSSQSSPLPVPLPQNKSLTAEFRCYWMAT